MVPLEAAAIDGCTPRQFAQPILENETCLSKQGSAGSLNDYPAFYPNPTAPLTPLYPKSQCPCSYPVGGGTHAPVSSATAGARMQHTAVTSAACAFHAVRGAPPSFSRSYTCICVPYDTANDEPSGPPSVDSDTT
jgi:hypothetical protein